MLKSSRLRYFTLTLLVFVIGCGNRNDPVGQDSPQDATGVKIVQSQTAELPELFTDQLSEYGIDKQNVSAASVSPDSQILALVLDSVVRFGPGDQMWSSELPSNWFGVRHRKILYLYYHQSDSLVAMAECEEIVNFYDAETSLPVQEERAEDFAALGWSPDGSSLLILKDRKADGVSSQDVLIFGNDANEPVFLEIFPVWQQVMAASSDAKGTLIQEIAWAGNTTIKVLISVKDRPEAGLLELYFDASSGELLSSRSLSQT